MRSRNEYCYLVKWKGLGQSLRTLHRPVGTPSFLAPEACRYVTHINLTTKVTTLPCYSLGHLNSRTQIVARAVCDSSGAKLAEVDDAMDFLLQLRISNSSSKQHLGCELRGPRVRCSPQSVPPVDPGVIKGLGLFHALSRKGLEGVLLILLDSFGSKRLWAL